jgi:hypothetical protein
LSEELAVWNVVSFELFVISLSVLKAEAGVLRDVEEKLEKEESAREMLGIVWSPLLLFVKADISVDVELRGGIRLGISRRLRRGGLR